MALGWLGWSEDQMMDADINSILVGFRGKMAMLKACYGSSEKDKDAPNKPGKPSVADFKSFTRTHNAVLQGNKR